MEIKPWVIKTHDALHAQTRWRKPPKSVTINKKRVEIQFTPVKGVPYLNHGVCKMIAQNPNTGSDWAAFARAGKRVTQVLLKGEYYGVIVENKVFKYLPGRKSELLGSF